MPTYTLASPSGTLFTYNSWWGYNRNNSSQANLPNVNITGNLNPTPPTYKYPILITSLTLYFKVRNGGSVQYALGTTQQSNTAFSSTFTPSATGAYARTISTSTDTYYEYYADRTLWYGWRAPNGITTYFGSSDAGQAGEYAINGVWQEQANGTSLQVDTDVALTGSINVLLIPSAPTISEDTVTTSTIKINWTDPSDNGGATITYFRIAYKAPTDTVYTVATVQSASLPNTYTITGLTSNTTYTIKVAAINSVADRFNNTTAPTGYTNPNYTTGTNGSIDITTDYWVKVRTNLNTWAPATVKRFNGAIWLAATVKKYNGTDWEA